MNFATLYRRQHHARAHENRKTWREFSLRSVTERVQRNIFHYSAGSFCAAGKTAIFSKSDLFIEWIYCIAWYGYIWIRRVKTMWKTVLDSLFGPLWFRRFLRLCEIFCCSYFVGYSFVLYISPSNYYWIKTFGKKTLTEKSEQTSRM